MRPATLRGVVAGAVVLSACTVGPDYHRPGALVPAQYKEARPQPGWKLGQPNDTISRGAWWAIYNDPVLDGLERRIDISNQNLKAAAGALRQAEEIVAEARAGFFPTGTVGLQAQRSRSGGSASSGTGSSSFLVGSGGHIGSFSATMSQRAGPPISGVRSAARSKPISRRRRQAPPIWPMCGSRHRARLPAIICNCASPTS